MALTKKQIKQLRAAANQIKPLVYIGKNDLSETAVNQADETIEKRELIKVQVQDGRNLPTPILPMKHTSLPVRNTVTIPRPSLP